MEKQSECPGCGEVAELFDTDEGELCRDCYKVYVCPDCNCRENRGVLCPECWEERAKMIRNHHQDEDLWSLEWNEN